MAARDEFDGISDHLAADQRCLHAFGTHGDAVANGDSVELHWRAAGRADAFFHVDSQIPQFVIAVHGFGPRVRDADDRFAQVFIGEADGFQHAARGRAVAALRDGVASQFHGNLLVYFSGAGGG